jgi:hypothetical protein
MLMSYIKNNKKILLSLVCLTFLFGCQEVIDFPLKESEKIPVIEAVLDMHTGICKVKVSQTQSLKEKEASPDLSGLELSLQYDNTISKDFKESEKGTYVAEKINTSPGKTYTLVIKKLMGQEYRANAIAPNLVIPEVDTVLNYTSGGTVLDFKWKDPQNQNNYYRPIILLNKVPQKSWFNITSDQGQNGNTMSANFYLNLKKNDEVVIQLQNLDAVSFQYYEQLFNLNFEDQLPYNPKNNFDKPTTGVFSIINYQPIKIRLK